MGNKLEKWSGFGLDFDLFLEPFLDFVVFLRERFFGRFPEGTWKAFLEFWVSF